MRDLSSSFQYTIKTFIETDVAPSYVYAGETYPGKLVSWFVQAPFMLDLNNDDTPDVVLPMNRGYQTGLDTRVSFEVFTSVDGVLMSNSEMSAQIPVTAGARRADLVSIEASNRQAAVTVAHETGDSLGADLIFIGAADIGGSILPEGIPVLPSAGLGRDTRVNAHSMAVGDVNGDGIDDILVGNWDGDAGPYLLTQQNAGEFVVSTTPFLLSLTDVPMVNAGKGEGFNLLIDLHLSDINSDGFDDLIAGFGHGSTPSYVYLNQGGDFDFSKAVDLPPSIYGIDNQQHLKTFSEDFDNDGDEDLIVLWSRFEPYYGGNYLQYLENVDGEFFVDRTEAAFSSPFTDAYGDRLKWTDYWQVGDFNSDGAIDLVGHSVFGDKPLGQVFLNNGLGVFERLVVTFDALRFAKPLLWYDFDGDMKLEAVVFESTWNNPTGTSSTNLFNVYELDFELEKVAIRSKSADLNGVPGQAYRIYKAAFDRNPMEGDTAGLGYWIAQMDDGMDMVEVAARFIDSAEFRSLYGQNPTNGEFLTKVYNNVLNRDPDAGGYAWWIDELENNPEKTWQKVLADFSESHENQSNVAQLIANGIVFDSWVG